MDSSRSFDCSHNRSKKNNLFRLQELKTMNTISKSRIISAGLAIFSMLFGAGNVIYPLLAGKFAQGNYLFATLGFLSSSVLFSFAAILGMVLFDGDYIKFFTRLGKAPGYFLTLLIMSLLGPLGAMPRNITVSYGSMQSMMPSVPLVVFSLIACALIFALTISKKRILDILGYVLTPLLLLCLLLIMVIGLYNITSLPAGVHGEVSSIAEGFSNGNQTMDMLGALCFSSIVFNLLSLNKKPESEEEEKHHKKKIFLATIKAGVIGLSILTLTYIAFIRIAAFYGHTFQGMGSVEVFFTLTQHVLGSQGSLVTSIAVALASLTTAIAIATVFSEFLHETIFNGKVEYKYCLSLTLLVTFFFSILSFDGLAAFLAPILLAFYPALAVLCFMNIAHKLFGWKMVKTPVLVTFLGSVALQHLPL